MKQYIEFYDGTKMPRFGLGTWHMCEIPARYDSEYRALEAGLNHGVTLIDTAEIYSDGACESLVGQVIKHYDRSKLFLVSKVAPYNAGGRAFFNSLNDSLARLNTSYLDLYLLHWVGEIPFEETIQSMEKAVQEGKIKHWGVSNLDTEEMKELLSLPNGNHCVVDQCLYHLGSRGVEYSLLPLLKEKGIGLMAYCPLAEAGVLKSSLLSNPVVLKVAKKYSISPIQLLLAFTLRDSNVVSIPKSGNSKHVLENIKASKIEIASEDWKAIDEAYPSPKHKMPLDMV